MATQVADVHHRAAWAGSTHATHNATEVLAGAEVAKVTGGGVRVVENALVHNAKEVLVGPEVANVAGGAYKWLKLPW
jgi:hypothetical protein